MAAITQKSTEKVMTSQAKDAMKFLFSKLDEAIDDMEQGRIQPLEEAWEEIDLI